MVARSPGGGRFTTCNSIESKPNPHRPATSQQPGVPAGTAIAERGHRRVPGLGGAPEDEPAGDPSNRHCSLVFGRRRADSLKIRMSTDLRELHSAWVQPPKTKIDNWQTVEECLSLSPHLTWMAVVDLSNFFFHLRLHPSAGR